MNVDYEDTDLIGQFLDGNEQAFNLLVRRHQDFVYNITRKITGNHDDADEAAQRVFIKLYEKIGTFDRRSAFRTWLYRVSTNESLNLLRSRKIRKWFGLGDMRELPQNEEQNPLRLLQRKDIGGLIEQAIRKLPDRQRTVFILRMTEGLSYDEISEILGVGIGGLKTSFHLAVKKLSKELGSYHADDL